MSATDRSNSSLLIGVVVSALTHVAALYAMAHIEIESGASRTSAANFAPPASIKPPPLQTPRRDPLPPPLPPATPQEAREIDEEVRFGDDRSTIESMTWLGTNEPTIPSGKLGEVDQAALSPEPGEEGSAGSPFVALTPIPTAPRPGATAASQPGAPTPSAPLASPPALIEPPPSIPPPVIKPVVPTDPSRPADPAASELKTSKDAPLPAVHQSSIPKPGSEEATGKEDPLAEPAGQGGTQPPQNPTEKKPDQASPNERPGLPVPPVEADPAIHNDQVKNSKDAGKSPDPQPGKPQGIDGREDEASVPEASPAPPLVPQPALQPLNVVEPFGPPQQPAPQAPPVSNPGASVEQEPGQTGPPASGSPLEGRGDGGQNRLQGRTSEQESEAFTSKPVVIPMSAATVQAGKGLQIITRRAVFTNTTRVTQQPRDTLVRIRFQRNGLVKKAEFLEGGSTGNPNIDEPILNAVHRWRAAGKDLDQLSSPNDTLAVVVRITFR